MAYQLTPRTDLPAAVLAAIEKCAFGTKPNRYGVTTLLQPIQQTLLKRRYEDEIVETPDEQVWRLFGSAFHKVLEIGAEEIGGIQLEQYIRITVLDRIVGGVIDLHIDDDSINDYKVTKAWSLLNQSRIDDWVMQLNIYRYIMFKDTGKLVSNLRIVAFFRDWERKFTSNEKYPQKKLMWYDLPVLPLEEVEEFIVSKVRELVANESLPDAELTPCTAEEMWEHPTQYALYKERKVKGEWTANKTATRVFDAEDQVAGYTRSVKTPLKAGERWMVQVRPGRRVRCEGVFDGGDTYCPVAHKCAQHKAYLESKGKCNGCVEKGNCSGCKGSACKGNCNCR
jgi:hypothetical protein